LSVEQARRVPDGLPQHAQRYFGTTQEKIKEVLDSKYECQIEWSDIASARFRLLSDNSRLGLHLFKEMHVGIDTSAGMCSVVVVEPHQP
jgi:hypothetical protein